MQPLNREYYAYERFVADVRELVRRSAGFKADTLVAVARGGWMLGAAFSQAVQNRRLVSVNSVCYDAQERRGACTVFNLPDLSQSRRVLILDDICDSGVTLDTLIKALKRRYPSIDIKTATLYYKPTAIVQPDFTLHEATAWIDFFWEKDFLPEAPR